MAITAQQQYGILGNPALDDQTQDQSAPIPTIAPAPAPQGQLQPIRSAPAPAQSLQQAPLFKANPFRQQQEQAIQSQILAQENKPKLQGFWPKAASILGHIGNAAGTIILGNNVMDSIAGTEQNRAIQGQQREQELRTLQNQDALDQKNFEQQQNDVSKRNLEGAQATKAGADTTEANARADSLKNPQPKSPFELWHAQNPTGTAEDFAKVEAKPLSADEANARNAVWDTIAPKYHLPTGQFKEGMSGADAAQLAAAMNNVVGRDQGAQKIVIQNQTAANSATKATDAATEKEFGYYRGKWDKDLGLYNSQNEKLQEASSLIGRGALGDALGAIKSLSGLASGAGSGVRITQAELNSIARARGLGGDFQAALQKFGDGKNLTPQQETQLKGILASVQAIAGAKEKVINQGLDDLSNAKDAATIRKIDSQLRHVLMGG